MRVIKSPDLLERMRAAREQSAVELIAQGLITVPLSPRQQQAYDDTVRYAAEIDAREREYHEQLPTQIAADNERITSELDAGRLYLANEHGDGSTPTIHFASCFSIRHQVDRDVAHQFDQARDGESTGSWHAGPGVDYFAKWPNLMTLNEVEELQSYRACQSCTRTPSIAKKAAPPRATRRSCPRSQLIASVATTRQRRASISASLRATP